MSIKIETSELNEFFKYLKDFYGRGGIYAEFFVGNPLTDGEILKGIEEYLSIVDENSWGGGDSMDRENVKWIMMSNRHDSIAKQIAILKDQLKRYPKLEEKNLENFNKLSFGI